MSDLGSGSDTSRSVALILLSMDQREITLRCLQSVVRTTGVDLRIVLWDNGSTDGTAEAVRARYPEVTVFRSQTNIGVAGGRNRGARIAIEAWRPQYLFFIDNDMEVDPVCAHELVRAIESDSRVAQATGKIRMLGRSEFLYGAGGCILDFRRGKTGHVAHGERDDGRFERTVSCLPSGGCMMVRTEVFEALRGFDETFNPYGPEDLDFGLRVRRAGHIGVYTPSAVVYHETVPGHTGGGGMHSFAYARRKARHWLILLHRHASARDKMHFYLIGGPTLALRVLWRSVPLRLGRRAVVDAPGAAEP